MTDLEVLDALVKFMDEHDVDYTTTEIKPLGGGAVRVIVNIELLCLNPNTDAIQRWFNRE